MSKFKFNVTRTTQNAGKEKVQVDWNALNTEVVEAAKTATKSRSIPGVISGIYDLGEQEREDAEYEFAGDAAAEAAEIEKFPETYFKDGLNDKNKPVRLKCYPQKPVQQVAVAVDFPQVIVDKGKHFGNSNPQPLRMLLNREFTLSDKTKVVASPYSVTATKYDDGTWAFAKNNGLHKLAAATDSLDEKGYFKPEDLADLIGKVAQFEFRVWMKPDKKDKTKAYFTEDIKLSGMVPEGVVIPEYDESILHMVNMHVENDAESVKQMRVSIRNTQQRAKNFEGSVLEAELAAAYPNQAKKEPEKTATDDAPVIKPEESQIQPDFDSDVPFAPIGLMEGRLFLHMI